MIEKLSQPITGELQSDISLDIIKNELNNLRK